MPENDIYNNKRKYEQVLENLELLSISPCKRIQKKGKKPIYCCKNKNNLRYFKKLSEKFDVKDLGYGRRCRLFSSLILICHAIDKDLAECDRDNVDKIVAFMHTRYKSQKSKIAFIKDIKNLWGDLFPEEDERGRIDETICPYPVRHLKAMGDKSRQKARADKLTWEEFESIINYFADNPKIQAFLTIVADSYGRPQEVLYTRIKNLELYDNYAILHISEHGKEGIGSLLCIDSYPYLLKWYNQHPIKNNKEELLFISGKRKIRQLKPRKINDLLKIACKHLNINKPITCYSFKRNGITFARQRGDSDVEIQHKARWTSIAPLKIYDQTTQDDAFRISLAKRGLIKDDSYKKFFPKTKTCMFCGFDKIGFTEDTCIKCKHIVDRDKVNQEIEFSAEKIDEINRIKTDNQKLQEALLNLTNKYEEMAKQQEIFAKMAAHFIKAEEAAEFIEEKGHKEHFIKNTG